MQKDEYDTFRIRNRAIWLTRLRWFFVLGVIVVALSAKFLTDIPLKYLVIIIISLSFVITNLISLFLIRKWKHAKRDTLYYSYQKLLNFQVSTDLFILVLLLHYSGGIENPFFLYLLFHMVVASTLLPPQYSYLHASLAVVLLSGVALAEYLEIIPHYCLEGFLNQDLHRNQMYLFVIIGVFATTSYLVVYMTISISKQLRKQEYAYRKANLELKEQDKIKNEYVLRLTHDIKGHLAAIQTNLTVVEPGLKKINFNELKFFTRAFQRTQKLTKFVKDLLHLTKLRLDTANIVFENFAIDESFNQVIENHRIALEAKKITLKYDIKHEGGYVVHGNPVSIEEMLSNIIQNSITYTPQEGEIEILLSKSGRFVQIDISDTGIGIPEEDQKHIFTEFYRASNVKNEYSGGTGIGLSLVKQIIDRHCGKIWVESTVGNGTTFTILLPEKSILAS